MELFNLLVFKLCSSNTVLWIKIYFKVNITKIIPELWYIFLFH